ncbi:MAG: hypothetical protein KF773_34585 [Deltaproteobacteria bacterium]|nr:hypothetical protein [Deltaproteobacteria bacterium]
MSRRHGQEPGHELGGLSWGELVDAVVAQCGTLTAVAWKLIDRADGDDVASVERALRRLRTRGQRDGGRWGQHLLRTFGVPAPIEARLRWMGHYHSPFNDLPVGLCLDQLRLWDRPPIASSRARVWLHLGEASCALRTRRLGDAAAHVRRAAAATAPLPAAYDAARIELALVTGYLASRGISPDAVPQGDERLPSDDAGVDAALARAEQLIAAGELSAEDRACFAARLVDQRAYQHNLARDHARALALYATIAPGVHPFASYRRAAGLAYGALRTGRPDEARALALEACEHAGDGGYTRLRAMGLILLGRIDGPASAAGAASLDRARAIARRLGDDELLARADRAGT